ncbi:MAG: carboxypeptidase regulatory-like domain-containing protein [Bacteroidetes bacterium]|nr:carboxypeptidase regulatory-like domain-containing protein [Bacteroidota bacterium]
MIKQLRYLSGVFFFCCLQACSGQLYLSIHVLDDDGDPVENARIRGNFTGGEGKVDYDNTDKRGKATLSGPAHGRNDLMANKAGYYETHIIRTDWKPGKIDVTLLLREKRNPIAMYARRFPGDYALSAPYENKKTYSFDFFESDLVQQGRRGIVEDIYFDVTVERVAPKDRSPLAPFRDTLKVSFPDNGNGIQKADLNAEWRSSEYKMAYHAPTTGYDNELETIWGSPLAGGGGYIKKNIKETFYLRIRTERDEQGNITSAHYCKIVNGIVGGGQGRLKKEETKEVGFAFTYYCNPTPNDTNIEFDPRQNLLDQIGFDLEP